MAGNNTKKGGSRGAGGAVAAATPARTLQPARIGPQSFNERLTRADKDRAYLRRSNSESARDLPYRSTNPERMASDMRVLRTSSTARRAREFYKGLTQNRTTGMPQSVTAGFNDRQRLSTGTKKKAGRKRSRLVKA